MKVWIKCGHATESILGKKQFHSILVIIAVMRVHLLRFYFTYAKNCVHSPSKRSFILYLRTMDSCQVSEIAQFINFFRKSDQIEKKIIMECHLIPSIKKQVLLIRKEIPPNSILSLSCCWFRSVQFIHSLNQNCEIFCQSFSADLNRFWQPSLKRAMTKAWWALKVLNDG